MPLGSGLHSRAEAGNDCRGRCVTGDMRKLLGPLLALLVIGLAAPAHGVTGHGVTARERASVPWDQVGDGWLLTTIVRGPGGEKPPRARSLELISPEGTRYPLYSTTRQPLKRLVDPGNFRLISWDPEERTALLKRFVSPFRAQAIRVDLESGSSQSLALPRRESSTALRPDGAGVLSQTVGGKVFAIAWDGTRTLVGKAGQGNAITTPDGSAAVIGGPSSLTVMPLDGSATREIATPGECRPLRWYADTQLLTSCFSRQGSQLMTVGLDGTVAAVGGLRGSTSGENHGPSWDDTDVRIVGGRSYYEGNGSCGGSFITRENAAGKDKLVKVPGSRGGISLLDARDDRLVIAHTATCDGGPPRAVLSLFDPVSRDEEVLLTLGRREHWAQLLVWDEPRPWSF